MNWFELYRNVIVLDEAGADAVRDGLNQLLLGRFLCVINAENILAFFGRCLVDLLDHTGKIGHVDCGNQVVSFTNDWKPLRVLKPRFLEMAVEDFFSLAIEDTA